MATLKTVIIDTDETYSGWTYNNIADAEAFHQGNITAATGTDEYVVFECYATSGSADTTVVFDGWTTEYSGQNYVEINGSLDPDYGHSGIWDNNQYRIEGTAGSSTLATTVEHFRVIGIQALGNQTTGNRHIINMNSMTDATGEIIVSYNIIKGNNGSTYQQQGIDAEGAVGQVIKVYNNIIYDISTAGSAYCIYMTSSGYIYIYNNTLIRGTYAVNRNAGSIIQINNICQDQTDRATDSTNADSGYNVVEDATLVANSLGGTNTDLTTGTATSYGANQLNDSGGGLSVAKVGSIIANTTDSTYASVTVVDSDILLTLSADIFDTGNEAYRVTSNIYGTVSFSGATYLLASDDTVAMENGTDLSGDSVLPITDDILGTTRPK